MIDVAARAAGASRTSSIGCATTRKAITIAVFAAMTIPARIGKGRDMSDHFTDVGKTASFENTPETKRCSKDTIYRQAAIDAIADYLSKTTYTSAISFLNTGAMILARVPSAEPGPCDVCVYNEDCEEMRIYCPARGVTE